MLFDTDYVIYDEANDHVLQHDDGLIIVYGIMEEALNDLYGNERVVKCTDLPKHWQEKLLNEINQ